MHKPIYTDNTYIDNKYNQILSEVPLVGNLSQLWLPFPPPINLRYKCSKKSKSKKQYKNNNTNKKTKQNKTKTNKTKQNKTKAKKKTPKTISWTKLLTYISIYYSLEVEFKIRRSITGSWECLYSEGSKHNLSNDYFHHRFKIKTVVVYCSVGLWFMTFNYILFFS